MKTAVYPGSFDPITYGHIDIAQRALKVFDKLIIMISDNPNKAGMFTPEEKKDMIQAVLSEYNGRIDVVTSHDLTVRATKLLGASHIIRGLRAVTDFEYEFQLTSANRLLDKDIDSIFFMTDNKYSFISSTTVKEIALFKGELSHFVPKYIEDKIIEKIKKGENCY